MNILLTHILVTLVCPTCIKYPSYFTKRSTCTCCIPLYREVVSTLFSCCIPLYQKVEVPRFLDVYPNVSSGRKYPTVFTVVCRCIKWQKCLIYLLNATAVESTPFIVVLYPTVPRGSKYPSCCFPVLQSTNSLVYLSVHLALLYPGKQADRYSLHIPSIFPLITPTPSPLATSPGFPHLSPPLPHPLSKFPSLPLPLSPLPPSPSSPF